MHVVRCSGFGSLAILLYGIGGAWPASADSHSGSSAVHVTPAAPLSAENRSASGAGHFLSLRADGAVWASGSNTFGQLGDGTTEDRRSLVPIFLAGVKEIAAGSHHSLFLLNNGDVYAAGRNDFGQLGDECYCTPGAPECAICMRERPPRYLPTLVKLPGIVQADLQSVAAGDGHSVFLRTDGSVYACGLNSRGQLGDNTVTSRRSPVFIDEGVSNIAAGPSYTLLLKPDGSVYATGGNTFGQLGDGTTEDRRKLVLVHTGVDRIWVGVTHSMFYLRNGGVFVTGVS
mmetsp:Transcript_48784/g.136541  ORF Transcript_48784/g.136541 Transcript_48784/m.136541 type:complete len:287 (-) Transcript_48784:85-945(-)